MIEFFREIFVLAIRCIFALAIGAPICVATVMLKCEPTMLNSAIVLFIWFIPAGWMWSKTAKWQHAYFFGHSSPPPKI